MVETDEFGLYSNLKQCLIALRQLRQSHLTAHPVVKTALKSMDDHLLICLKVCSGGAKKIYPYVFDILNKVHAKHHSRLSLYYSHSPYWQHYIGNMADTVRVLESCCSHRTADGHASVHFHRKFQPFSTVGIRRPMESFISTDFVVGRVASRA